MIRIFFGFWGLVLINSAFAQSKMESRTTEQIELEAEFDVYLSLADEFEYTRVDSALWASLEAIEVAKKLGNFQKLALAHKVAGIYYSDAGLYEKSVDSYYKAIAYYDSTNSPSKVSGIAGCYHNLAWVYANMEENENVAPLFHKSMSLKSVEDRADSIDFAVSLHALGSFYSLNDPLYDSAVYYLKKTVAWREYCQMEIEGIAQAEVELAEVYYENDQLNAGDQVVAHLLTYPEDSISDYIKLYLEYLEGVKLEHQGKYKAALEKLVPIYEYGEANNSHLSSVWTNLLRKIVKVCRAGNLHEEGFYYLEKLRENERQSIYKDRQRRIKALEVIYETKRKETQIETQQAQISQQNKVIWIVAIAALTISVLFVFLFKSYKQIRLKNQKIETLMRELHHRVKNNLQVISSLLGLQSMRLEDEAALKAVEEGKERIRAMSLIHQKLYQQDEVTALNINEYIHNLVDELAQSYVYSEKARININVPCILLDVDTSLPVGLIINELVSNAFKYAFEDIEKPILDLSLIQHSPTKFTLSIGDNGKGLPAEFSMEQAKSFGFKLVKLLTRQLKGELILQNENGLSYQLSFSLR